MSDGSEEEEKHVFDEGFSFSSSAAEQLLDSQGPDSGRF